MNSVLILYPKQFQSQSKFERKVNNIIGSMKNYRVIAPFDLNEFIDHYFSSKLVEVEINPQWSDLAITHAIIFDDGEEFSKETIEIEKLNIPIRKIKIKITRVVNIKKETQYAPIKSTNDYEYIGRGSYWGNPYSMFTEGESREEVIRKFKYDFDFEKFPKKNKSEVYKLAGKRLGCFCKPEACHGDILADFLNSWDDGE